MKLQLVTSGCCTVTADVYTAVLLSESVSWIRFERSLFGATYPRSGTVAQLFCNSLEGIGQHCTLPRIELTGVVLDPSLPVAACLDRQPLLNLGTGYSRRS